ncbi:uncharacterized protein BO95DRAFT_209181 [Aspergillus brunneoviolaceus CBS 621.78]|uniref:Uncharacterized protein n=1 Tax=Aspergillus brunneoviolaceus CBS 621.78 TaxID=1450534 RepID=A0ACD1G262_9EURO|nr:hypothetical protein BO95DRAFT_209181 [Aspergillus brunneoviolaceus CBS 621.78]RAH43361.1 hypothetical protein BO95DRAFT_209181 [Aspergillus brunneoviolaceus CBS 621.78]
MRVRFPYLESGGFTVDLFLPLRPLSLPLPLSSYHVFSSLNSIVLWVVVAGHLDCWRHFLSRVVVFSTRGIGSRVVIHVW